VLENIDLKKTLSQEEYQEEYPRLRERLSTLQSACAAQGIPVVILFEGWDAAGTNAAIEALSSCFDPHGFTAHAIGEPEKQDRRYPWMHRFWLAVPHHGAVAIFDRSWYRRVLDDRVLKQAPYEEWRKGFRDIVDFEQALADDRTVIIKFFLHISHKEQERRLKLLKLKPARAWQVWRPGAKKRHRKYDQYLAAIEEALERTDTREAPWTIVAATSRWYMQKKVLETVVERLDRVLGDAASAGNLSSTPAGDRPAQAPDPENPDA
jgi:polyphosphate kinase 2 (PPK2 family)